MTDYSSRDEGAAGWVLSAVRRNPEGLLFLAAGAALLMRRGSSAQAFERAPRRAEFYGGRNDGVAGSERNAKNLGDRVTEAAEVAREYASEMTESAMQTASSYASSISDYADEATDRSWRFAQQAQSTVVSTAQQILQDQPLAVALVGLAAGAAVAAAFPATDLEKRALGPAGERVRDAAGKAGEQLKEAGAKAGESLMNAAEERGLTKEGLKDVASEVGDAFSEALSGEASTNNRATASYKAGRGANEQAGRPQAAQSASTSSSYTPPEGKRGSR